MVYRVANLLGRSRNIRTAHNASADDYDGSAVGYGLGTGDGIYAACGSHRSLYLCYDLLQEVDSVATCHLLVYTHVNADVVHAKLVELTGALHWIGNSQQI